jgi:hypothetical protein
VELEKDAEYGLLSGQSPTYASRKQHIRSKAQGELTAIMVYTSIFAITP